MVDTSEITLTVADLAAIQSLITLEIVVACSSSAAEADQRLYAIAQRLSEVAEAATNERDRVLFWAVASGLAATGKPTRVQ